MTGVLQGIRVLDFGRYIAGPYCAALLAEQGAEVIRIEKRGEGSEDRVQAPITEGGDGASLHADEPQQARSSRSIPMKAEGQEVVRRLVATADVVIANLPPRTLQAMRLDYESLKAVKPDIILATATAYGRGGPYSDRVGFDGDRPGHVRGGLPLGWRRGAARALSGAVGRLRHCAASGVRHDGGPDAQEGYRARPMGGRARSSAPRSRWRIPS